MEDKNKSKDTDKNKREEFIMEARVKEKSYDKTEMDKISDMLPILGGKKGMIKLNEKEPNHAEWFNEEER